MNMKIFYFTGTGNSLYIAKRLSSMIDGCTLEGIAKYNNENKVVIKEKIIGIVCPLYFSGIPGIVHDFIKKADFTDTKYIFAVINAGLPLTSSAIHIIDDLLKKKNKKLDSGFCLKMIDNYIINFKMPPHEYQIKLEAGIEKKLSVIKNIITGGMRHKDFELFFLSGLIHKPWIKKSGSFDQGFYSTEKCNSCRTCEKVCPVNNIEIINGRPEWHNKCRLCLACIHYCPVRAVQYRGKTENKTGRYHNRNIKISEIMDQK